MKTSILGSRRAIRATVNKSKQDGEDHDGPKETAEKNLKATARKQGRGEQCPLVDRSGSRLQTRSKCAKRNSKAPNKSLRILIIQVVSAGVLRIDDAPFPWDASAKGNQKRKA